MSAEALPIPRSRAANRTLIAIGAVVATDMIGFGIVIPLLPFYAEALGATPFELALIVACYPAAQLLAFPIVGRLSDLFGRKPLIIGSLAVSAVSYIALGFADTLPALLGSRILAGLGGATYTVSQAFVADSTDAEGRTAAISRIGGAYAVGLILGPIIGGYASLKGFSLAGFIAATLSMSSLIIALLLLPQTSQRNLARRRVQAPLSISAWLRAYTRYPLGLLGVTLLLTSAAFEGTMAMLAIYFERKIALRVQDAGVLWAWSGAVVVLIRFAVTGALARRIGEKSCSLLGLVCLASGAACALITSNFLLALCAASLLATGYSLVYPTMASVTSQVAAENSQGSVLGGYMVFGGLGRTVGPLMAGAAFQSTGIDSPMIAATIVFLIAACLSLAFPTTAAPR